MLLKKYVQLPVRESDQRVFVADFTKSKELIGWDVEVTKEDGIRKMIEWEISRNEKNN